jgi:cell division protein FtsQ
MQNQKSKKVLVYFFLFLFFGTLNNKNLNDIEFLKIKEVAVIGLDEENNFKIKNNLNFLKINYMFFLDDSQIIDAINSNSLVEQFVVSKKYPSTLNIKVNKTKILARFKKDGNNFFLGSNGKFIKMININYKTPFIFGDFKNENLFELKEAIDKTKFNYEEIKNLFSFKSGRWDIETKDGLLIKLPKDEIQKSLNLLLNILEKDKEKKINKIDLRQLNQVIING